MLELASRLRERLPEVEQTIFARMVSVADPAEVEDPEYIAGLHQAVKAGIEYGLAAVEGTGAAPAPIPEPLLAQARGAARLGISLDVILRRYFAGYTVLGEFVAQEAEKLGRRGGDEARRFVRVQAPLLDHLVAAVTKEHRQEIEDGQRSAEHARVERVRKLLAGELVDDPGLGYELGGYLHLGAVGAGPGILQAFRELATRFDRRLLLVRPAEGTAWAWLGGKKELSAEEVASAAPSLWPEEASLALGECAYGISGWRLTQRQALACFRITSFNGLRIVSYGGTALLATALADDLLSSSLYELYLVPLTEAPDRGAALRQTLRAYFASGRNASSAAARLGVSRKTVASRLQSVEERIGHSLAACAAEMETALRLQELSSDSPLTDR